MLVRHKDAQFNTAFSGADDLHQLVEQSARRERVGVSVAVASFAAVALIWVALLGRVLWQPQTDDTDAAVATTTQCQTIADDHARLGCYDGHAREPGAWPAKGAPAPLVFHQSNGAAPSR